ncbi:hypothetical protein Droror1_Dr00005279 [Drosera rotundifolia]
MADEGQNTTITTPHPPKQPKKLNPRRFYTHFLFKALIGTLFLLLVPLRAPDEDSLITRSWEIIQLVFVGVAVSYGLFSRRNNEEHWGEATEGKLEGASAHDGYVSRLLSVSSVFDGDDGDVGISGKGFDGDDGEIERWSSQSQYRRNDPVVVEMPLSLPVRRLKSRGDDRDGGGLDDGEGSRVSRSPDRRNSSLKRDFDEKSQYITSRSRGVDADGFDSYVNGIGGIHDDGSISSSVLGEVPRNGRNGSFKSHVGDADDFSYDVDGDVRGFGSSISRSSSNGSSVGRSSELKTRNIIGEFGVLDGEERMKGTEDSIVLPSPIPWRSRSMRMELKKDNEKLEPRRSFGSQTSRNSVSHSLGESIEDEEERIRYYIPSPPPPPPLPQYRAVHKSPLFTSKSVLDNGHNNTGRSVRSEPKDYGETRHLLVTKSAHGNGEIPSEKIGMRSSETMSKRDRSAPRTSSLSDYPKETIDEVSRKAGYDNVDDVQSETDDNQHGRKSERKNEAASTGEDLSNGFADESPDVDKKADEFIAKFREQIRLQRIDSIKRSTLRVARDS